ncbi:phospholipase D family protein [Desulfopila inferna]|uniref:phospholipase D family protein n=1 Tax=Desulfopila inferna TaxID=468528 RepID=UPI001965E1D5|nr:phospholipase D family protein [Desulfopila inferna]MBM9606733.1 phospholipase D family protein [Desulfopila inferna]
MTISPITGNDMQHIDVEVSTHYDELYKLFKSLVDCSCRKVIIVAPFIKLKALRYLLDDISGPSVTVITSWREDDVLAGVSDIDVFDFISKNRGQLYINNELHAKCVVSDDNIVLFSSANITKKGLGIISPANKEFAVVVKPVPQKTRKWVDKLLQSSKLITQDIFDKYKFHIAKQSRLLNGFEKCEYEKGSSGLTITSLPVIDTPELFISCINQIQNHGAIPVAELKEKFNHDAQIFGTDLSKPLYLQRRLLKEAFFKHPFVSEFRIFVGAGKYFGESKAWLQNICEDLPKPFRKQLTGHVRILFDWVKGLSDGVYEIDRPNYSEYLYVSQLVQEALNAGSQPDD